MPKVSILLTSYNHAPFLAEAIDSVLAQTFKDYELIIWDDNSTDDSWQIIQSYTDARIKAFRNPVNKGPVYGVNKTIFEVATGEFFAMHHSDDVWVIDKLQKQLECFDCHPQIAAVFTHVQAIAEEGFDLDDEDHHICQVFDQPNRTRYQWLRHFLLHGNALCHPSVLIRRNAYSECGPYSEALWQLPDFDMWVRLLLKHDIYVLPQKLTKFRVLNSEANTSSNRPENRKQWAFEFPQVLNHYRSIQSLEELLEVLPEAALFDRGSETMVNYALAQTILNLTEIPTAHLFALNLLYEQLNSPVNQTHVQRLYDFGALELARLTRKYDPYSQGECLERALTEQSLRRVNEQLQEKSEYFEWYLPIVEQKILDLNAEIEGMKQSISWRISAPIRLVGWLKRFPRELTEKINQLPENQKFKGGFSAARNACAVLKRDWQATFSPEPQEPMHDINPGVGSGELDRNDYKSWVKLYDTLDESKVCELTANIAALKQQPIISVLLYAQNTNLQRLRGAVDSVRNQIYQNWQLCIAVNAAPGSEIEALVREFELSDSRICLVFSCENSDSAAVLNAALKMAQGQWLVLLQQDGELSLNALARVAEYTNRHHDAGLIYSDEDRIDEHGQRLDPYFKPDWDPYLFLSQNFVSRLGVYRRDLVSAVNGFRAGFEGAQDYDLALRVMENISSYQIVHIPQVLYHHRLDGSNCSASRTNHSAQRGVALALAEHFQRTGVEANVECVGSKHRIRYKLPSGIPLVSLIIPTRNALALVKQCIESILHKTTYPNYEILLIDNASDQPEALAYFAELNKHPKVRVIRDERPFNYSALNNNAVAQAHGEVIGLINNDIEVISPNWLEEMVAIALQPGVGAVGACLWYPDGTLQHGGVVMGIGGCAGHAQKNMVRGSPGYNDRGVLVQTYSAVTAACLIVKKESYLAVGGLDERYLTVAFNDVDFCLKLREAGCRNIWTPYAELYHHESATRGKEDTPEKQERAAREISYMQRKWKKIIGLDPAYSTNLSIAHEDFSLAWPPRSKNS